MTTPTVQIDATLQHLLPPLSAEELDELEASILAEGIREPLIVWQERNVLLDGHNRKRIADTHSLSYRVTHLSFASREEARLWVIHNQLGRRNLKPDAASYLRGLLVKAAPREERKRTDLSAGQNVTQLQALAEETGVDRRTLHRDAQFAEAVDALAEAVGEDVRALVLDGPVAKKDTVRLASLPEDEQRAIVEEVRETGKAPWQNIHSSNSNEWYTPEKYIKSAVAVMGGIDVDPASNPSANEVVQAGVYYTADTDGLAADWPGRVWLNPPWGGLQEKFVGRLMEQVAAGLVTEAIVLVNAHSTDTRWFQPLWDHTLCFTDHRINYYGTAGSGSTHGSVFVYIGPRWEAFAAEFQQYGAVVRRVTL